MTPPYQSKNVTLTLSILHLRDSLAAGVVEPAISKIKSLRFATEAAITILRIDDLIKVSFVFCFAASTRGPTRLDDCSLSYN